MGQIDMLRQRETMWRALYEGCEGGGKLAIPLAAIETSLTLVPEERLASIAATAAFATMAFGVGCAACTEFFGSRLEECQNEILFLQDDTNA